MAAEGSLDAAELEFAAVGYAPARLAEAMRQLLDDPHRAREIGRHARQRAIEHFSIDAMAERFARLYQREALA